MIEKVPQSIKIYISYYKYLKQRKLTHKFEFLTAKMMKNIDDPSVPTDEWMDAHIIRADALVELGKISEAIETLEKLVHIIPPLPIPGLSYLAKLENKFIKEDEVKDVYEEGKNEEGSIKFTYDNISQSNKNYLKKEDEYLMAPLKEEDEEESGEITITVTPSEVPARNTRINELGFSDRGRLGNSRHSRHFSSSLFLSAARN